MHQLTIQVFVPFSLKFDPAAQRRFKGPGMMQHGTGGPPAMHNGTFLLCIVSCRPLGVDIINANGT